MTTIVETVTTYATIVQATLTITMPAVTEFQTTTALVLEQSDPPSWEVLPQAKVLLAGSTAFQTITSFITETSTMTETDLASFSGSIIAFTASIQLIYSTITAFSSIAVISAAFAQVDNNITVLVYPGHSNPNKLGYASSADYHLGRFDGISNFVFNHHKLRFAACNILFLPRPSYPIARNKNNI
jgi:hypothetical protein